jgi:hypothetical protein
MSTQRSWYYSPARNESLVRCMQAAKDYLTHALSIPSAHYHNLSCAEIIRLVYAILIIGAFATSVDAPTLDRVHTRETTDLNNYLNALIAKVEEVSPKQGDPHNMHMSHLSNLLLHYKLWFEQIANDPMGIGSGIIERPGFSFADIMPTIMKKCLDWDEMVNSGLEMMSEKDEGWEDILTGWNPSLEPSTMSVDNSLG